MKLLSFFIVVCSLCFVKDVQAQELFKKRFPLDHPSYNLHNYKHPNKALKAVELKNGMKSKSTSAVAVEEKEQSYLSTNYKKHNNIAKIQNEYITIQVEKIQSDVNPYLSPWNYKDQRSNRLKERLSKRFRPMDKESQVAIMEEDIITELID